MPSTYVDPRIYGEISDEEKAFKLRQLYPDMFVNSTDPNYPGGFGQNIDYSKPLDDDDDPLLPEEEGEDPSALGRRNDLGEAPAVGSPGTAGSDAAAADLAKSMGPNSPGAAQVPKSFLDKYGGWGGEPQGGAASTTADGTPDPMGGWGGVPNATPPASSKLGANLGIQTGNIDPGIEMKPPPGMENIDRGIELKMPAGMENIDPGIMMGGPLGIPDTTPTRTPAGPPMAIPRSSGQYTSPAGSFGTLAREGGPLVREPALPTGVPPAPARRLQPPVDRVALYQKLRPYPGMSRSEKMSNMISAAFASAAQPGTGNDFKDAMRGFAQGNAAYQGVVDYDRATRANYATSVLGQLAAQEEAARKGADTEADIIKKNAEANRANAYAPYLIDRGGYYRRRGETEAYEAQTKRTAAEAIARESATKIHNAPEGTAIFQIDPRTGVPINRGSVGRTAAPDASYQGKAQLAEFYVGILPTLLNREITPQEAKAAAEFGMYGYPPGGTLGTVLAQVQRIRATLPPDQWDAAFADLKSSADTARVISPPPPLRAPVFVDPVDKPSNIDDWVAKVLLPLYTNAQGVVDYEGAKKAVYMKKPDGTPLVDMSGLRTPRLQDVVTKIGDAQRGATAPRTAQPPKVEGLGASQQAAARARALANAKTAADKAALAAVDAIVNNQRNKGLK